MSNLFIESKSDAVKACAILCLARMHAIHYENKPLHDYPMDQIIEKCDMYRDYVHANEKKEEQFENEAMKTADKVRKRR